MVDVEYSITFDYTRYYTESELEEASPELLSKLSNASAIEGAIVIKAPEMCTTRIIDELIPWIQNLCFRGVPDIFYGQQVHINYFSRSGYIDFIAKGDQVLLKGDLVNEACYPRREFLHELFKCGKRFLEFMKKVKQHDVNYMANVNYVEKFIESAQLVLQD